MTTYSTDYDTQTKVENNRSFARSSPECRPITSDRGRFAKIYCPWLTSLLDMSLSQPPSSPNPTSLLTQPSFSPNLPPHPTSLLTQPSHTTSLIPSCAPLLSPASNVLWCNTSLEVTKRSPTSWYWSTPAFRIECRWDTGIQVFPLPAVSLVSIGWLWFFFANP